MHHLFYILWCFLSSVVSIDNATTGESTPEEKIKIFKKAIQLTLKNQFLHICPDHSDVHAMIVSDGNNSGSWLNELTSSSVFYSLSSSLHIAGIDSLSCVVLFATTEMVQRDGGSFWPSLSPYIQSVMARVTFVIVYLPPSLEKMTNGSSDFGDPDLITKLNSNLLQFDNGSLPINSSVYSLFFFPTRRDPSLFLVSIWETYRLKRQVGVQIKVVQVYMQLRPDEDGQLIQQQNKLIPSGEDEDFYYTLLKRVGRRNNLYQLPIVAVIREDQADFMTYKKVKTKDGLNSTITMLGGLSVELYFSLQKLLNFSMGAIEAGSLKVILNGTALGGSTVETLNNGSTDLSLSASTMTTLRAKYLTFLQPVYYGIIHGFFKQPTANSIRNIVTAPFDTYVWISLIGTWVLFIIVIKISIKFILFFGPPSRFGKGGLSEYDPFFDHSLLDKDVKFAKHVGMWTIAASCQKSWWEIPNSIGLRAMCLIGILCGVLCYVGYSGAITSVLTITVVPVKQFSDLLKFNFLFTVHELSDPFQTFLKFMIKPEHLNQPVHTVSTEVEISQLLNPLSKWAFLTYPDFFYSTASDLNYPPTFICSQISKVALSPVLYKSAMFLKKGSVYRETFNYRIIMLKELGINHREVRRYESKNIWTCGESKDGSFDPIVITDVLTAFVLIAAGLCLSLLFLAVEVIVSKRKMRKKKAKR